MNGLTKKYRGIWYGAFKKPITAKELLDKIISCEGQGFCIITKAQKLILTDEENRGRFELTQEYIDYLLQSPLKEVDYFRNRLMR